MPSPIAEVTAGSVLTATAFNSLPRGYVNGSKKTSDQTGISTIADVTSMSVTFSMISGRLYRISVQLDLTPTVGTDVGVVTLTDGSNTALMRSVHAFGGDTNSQTSVIVFYEQAGSSGSVTRKVRVERATGSGTMTVTAASTRPALILVEDIGN